jgi:hypothetical protein
VDKGDSKTGVQDKVWWSCRGKESDQPREERAMGLRLKGGVALPGLGGRGGASPGTYTPDSRTLVVVDRGCPGHSSRSLRVWGAILWGWEAREELVRQYK